MQLIDRYQKLKEIREILLNVFGRKIVCAIAYGSTLCDDFYSGSDFDILLFVKNPDINFLKEIRKIKSNFKKIGTKIDFNVHSDTDLPKRKGECFWHNNRGVFVQTELSLQGLTIIGENPFLMNGKLKRKDLDTEAVKVINSLVYQARKLIINRENDLKERINLMKWCIYGSVYALAFNGKITNTKKEAMILFSNIFKDLPSPLKFLEAKLKNNVSDILVMEAYNFLSLLDERIFELWEERYGGK